MPLAWGEEAAPDADGQAAAAQGRALLQSYRKDPSARPADLKAALVAFTAAQKAFTAQGRKDEAAEAEANVRWCQRQLAQADASPAVVAAAPAPPPVPAPAQAPAGPLAAAAPATGGLPLTLFLRAPAAPPAQARPLADEEALKPVMDQLRTSFAKDYAKRGQEERRQFAARLFQESQKNRKDPLALQAILEESTRIAAESGDLVQVALSSDRLGSSFAACDATALKRAWFKKANLKATGAAYAHLLDEPEDAADNLLAGRYAAVELARWDEALPLLARGTPGPLALIATHELQDPDDGSERAALGEEWMQLAKRSGTPADERIAWLTRAQHWFQAARPDLEGLALDRVVQRLEELDKLVPLDLNRIDWAALTPTQWDKLPGLESAIPIRVARSGPAVQLGEHRRVRIVAHPNDQWKVQVKGGAPVMASWSGISLKRGSPKPAPAQGVPYKGFRLGELLMQLGNSGEPARLGVIEGPGSVWLLPNRPEGNNDGKIRIKVVPLDD